MIGYGYRFFDSDDSGTEERNIVGSELKNLYDICFKYCDYMSLVITRGDTKFSSELEQFRTTVPFIPYILGSAGNKLYFENNGKDIRFYKLVPELKELILKISEGIFGFVYSWGYHNPEDPHFYRSDGSIFLGSEIHEGELILMPRNGENISSIISNQYWIRPEYYKGSHWSIN